MKPTCGAKTRSGGPCRQRAGWGTDHVGAGRCKLHGGSNPIKHGIYSTVLRGPHRERMEHLTDAPIDDPSDDIKFHQVLIIHALEMWQRTQEDADGADLGGLTDPEKGKLAQYLWERLEPAVERHIRVKQRQQEVEDSVPLVDLVDYVNRLIAAQLPYVAEADRERFRNVSLSVPFSRH